MTNEYSHSTKKQPPRDISASELQAQLSAILAAVTEGESFVVTRRGAPIAVIQPLDDAQAAGASLAGEDPVSYGSSAAPQPRVETALARLIATPADRAVLAVFLGDPTLRLHQREVTRRSGLGLRSAQLALGRLERMGLLGSEQSGNRRYYHAVRSEGFEDLRRVLSRELGTAEVIARHLEPLRDRIVWAFVFGSVARGDDRVGSDVDLLVIGDVRSDELASPLARIEEELGRRIDLVDYRPDLFRKRWAAGNHFVTAALSEPRIDVIGSRDELRLD